VPLLLPSPAGLWGISPPLQCSGCPTLFVTCLFCCYCLLFSFFPLGRGWSVQWAMLIWHRIVCGSSAYCLAHLVVRIFPSYLSLGILEMGSHKVFSCAGLKLWPSCSQPPSSQDHRHEPLLPNKPFVCLLCIYLVWQHWGFTSTPQANYPLSQFFSFFLWGSC
jgi:hypothetical protein